MPAAFPPPKQERGDIPTGRSGIVDESVETLVSKLGRDRSRTFFDAIKAAHAADMTPDDLEDLMRKHPNECASKYLEPRDRLRKEIERAWGKLKERRKVEPTYPDNTDMDASLWASSGPHANARLRADARGRDGGVRQVLAAGIIAICQHAR